MDWQQRVSSIVATVDGDDDRRAPVIEYFVRAGRGGDDGVLVVHVRARFRRRNGELGARGASLPRDAIPRLPVADQWLLAAMAEHETGDAAWPGHRNRSLRAPWHVSASALPAVMAQLAATRRVFAADEGANDARPLRADAGAAFRFEVTLAPPDVGDAPARIAAVRVGGRFVRGDEVLGLDVLRGGVVAEAGVVVVADRLVRVVCGGAAALVTALVRDGPLHVPPGGVPDVLAALAELPGAGDFLASAASSLPSTPAIGAVTIASPRHPCAPLDAELHFDYAGTLLVHADGRPVTRCANGVVRRDAAVEARVHAVVTASGLAPHGDAFRCARAELPRVVTALSTGGVRVFAAGRRLRPWTAGTASVTSGIDWFDLRGEVEFAGNRVGLPELLRRKLVPAGFVELSDGSYGVLPAQWLRRVHAMHALGVEGNGGDGDTLRLPSAQALLLDELLGEEDRFAGDERFIALRERIAAFDRVEPAQEPDGFRGELRPYQRAGLGWLRFLRDCGLGGCLADDMGLGKTVQVLALLLGEHAGAASAPSLLVAPRSVLPNWLAEARRFAPALRVLDFSRADRWRNGAPSLAHADLVLTTYATLRADAAELADLELGFHYVVLDEAQAIKNAASQGAKAARSLRAMHRLALTGTPVENHARELWSLFQFLNPGLLGSRASFGQRLARCKDTGELAARRSLLRRALRPVLLRRTKAQVLRDLPPKVEQILWCELGPEQRRRYDELLAHCRAEVAIAQWPERAIVVLQSLLRLRQAACHEGLLDPARRHAGSAKLEALLPRLDELAAHAGSGHKALVFSQFTAFLDLVEPHLRARGIAFERLDGSTRDRAARVERFQRDPDARVFLISLKAGGVGLNLTAASYVFLLDPWWNPAVEMQAIDRAHRIGQQRTVHAYRLVCRGTVEERVLELQATKRELCDAILGNERSLLQDLTRQDLELLLR